jgi:S-adenosylmethionine synthetase
MYGYATNETPNYLPAPISYAHKLAKKLEEVRKNGTLNYLLPDGKTQVSVEYNDKDEIVRIDTVVISNQHKANVSNEILKAGIKKEVIDSCLGDLIDEKTIIHINPTGKFVLG